MKDIANKVGAKLEGLEYRLKSEESLTRKITGYVIDGDLTLEDARKEIRDAVRYTMVSDEENFTQNVLLARKKLEEQGLTFTKVSNTWYEGSSYKGINCNFKDNEGNIVELQFHTPISLKIKNINHDLYEKQRVNTALKNKGIDNDAEISMAMNALLMALSSGSITISQAMNDPRFESAAYLFIKAILEDDDELDQAIIDVLGGLQWYIFQQNYTKIKT